ncbi:hypothetical protein GCM10011495_25880 [Hymenobacter frigidus]|uniref:Integron Cassette Protein Hfx-Cass5 domain-containing protein n=1 Tax=Hymenobacter frigidus TaxID=1524095 RepID=A0ABQ2A9B4_9BACT|nr:hypothetical protein [Hymenobacter frigidus]GGH87298.1 hypothetical protein GCM10011495_25880 [Hymenobacter frigidus]
MRTDSIEEIGIDGNGRLFVKPLNLRFPMIWRSGAEVHWDAKYLFLYSPKPREWSYLDWYKHIIAVAMEGDGGYCELSITGTTLWTNVPAELQQQIMELS